jgi:hypothetical protein
MIDRRIEMGRFYGMEMNAEKAEVIRISRQPSPVQILTDEKNWRMWIISTIWVA